MHCPWGHPGSEWDSSLMTPLVLPLSPQDPLTLVSRARNYQGVCPPPGDKGHGGGNGASLAPSPPSTSLSPMGASLGVSHPWGGLGDPSPLWDGHCATLQHP